ncbi:MAG: leucine-rich repeat protein [Kiritimatiellae bacterium]|nr:leucine-rich repeat protein [Kiritimatiellia bacterium]
MKRSAKTGLLEIGGMFGDYCVVRLLGKGSMGEVYLLRDKDGNQYAAKIMCPPDDSGNDGWITRFTREARFAMTVQHKNLVAVHKVGKDEATGFCYIIMDYVPGGTLSERLEKNGRFSIREAVDITVQIASVLEVAHSVGVVHRDIKPDNILFDSDGSVKLSDLGVAKFRDTGTVMVTTAEMIIGTPAYMAPEQMLNSHNVDARADIYSLGLVLYEMLSGTRPHANSTVVELLTKAIKNEELPDIRTLRPEISIALSQVIAMMVATKPEERVATAMDVVKMLYEANSDRLILRKSSCPAGKSSAVRHRWWVWGGIVAGMAACAVVAWLVLPQMHKGTSQPAHVENAGNGQQSEDCRDVSGDSQVVPTDNGNAVQTGNISDERLGKLPVEAMPKEGLMTAYDYNDGAAVNFGYGRAVVRRSDVSYQDGVAVFNGKYQFQGGEDIVLPDFNYDHFAVAFSFKPETANEMFRIGEDASGMLMIDLNSWNGDHLSVRFSDPRVERVDSPVTLKEWNWIVCSVDVSRRLAMVSVNGQPPAERLLPADFYWRLPSDKIVGDSFRRLHFGNANRGIRYTGAIDDLYIYDRALTQKEIVNVSRRIQCNDRASPSVSSGAGLEFSKPKLVSGKWVLTRMPEISQYWNATISMGDITLGVRIDAKGVVVPSIGQLDYENIDLSLPVVDAAGVQAHIYAIGSEHGGVYCAGRSSVRTIKLPTTLRELRAYAISGCLHLKEISLPESLERIGDHAFYSCIMLESISIPENVREIGSGSFGACGCLAKVDIRCKNVTIAGDAFSGKTPVGEKMSKTSWTTGPTVIAVKGAAEFEYAKYGRMNQSLLSVGYGDIRFGMSCGDIGGWGGTRMRRYESLGEIDLSFHKVGPGLLAGLRLKWRKKVDSEGYIGDAEKALDTLISILNDKLGGTINSPKLLPISDWPTFGDRGVYYANYDRIQPIGTSMTELNGYMVKISMYGGSKDKNVAVIIEIVDSYMFKAWGVSVPEGIDVRKDAQKPTSPSNKTSWRIDSGREDRPVRTNNATISASQTDISGGQQGLNVAAMDISEFLVEGGILKGFAKPATNEVVVIPAGAGIKSVCIDGLTSNMKMKVLVLPEGVEQIDRASGGYRPGTSLEAVKIPASLTTIRPTGFDANWRHLNSIEVAQGSPYRMQDFCLIDTRDSSVVFALPGKERIVVPSGTKRIADWAFDDNDVREVVISEGVEKIGRGAFKGCRSMKKLIIPASVGKIGNEFLSGCGRLDDVVVAEANPYYCSRDGFFMDKLTRTLVRAFGSPRKVDVPADIRVIGAGAFSFMDSIVSLTVPDAVERIEEDAFAYCENLLELRLPDRLEYCDSHLISGCSSLKSVKFPVGLSHLAGNCAIGRCSSLREIVLPEGLLTIGAGGLGAIWKCDNLERIYIPASVATITSGGSFMDNPSLTCFEVSPDNPKFCAYEGVLFDKDMTRLIRCPDAKKGVFCVPASVKSIDYCAFSGCNNLSEIQLPEGIGVVNKWAFRGCSAKTNFVSSASQKTFEKVNARRAEVQE